jgi:hypothetical protein
MIMVNTKTAPDFTTLPRELAARVVSLEPDLRAYSQNRREEWDEQPESWQDTEEASEANGFLDDLDNLADTLQVVARRQDTDDSDVLEALREERAQLVDRLSEIDVRIARVNFGGSAAASL